MSKNHKISLCIVSMNRLHQLKQTLLENLSDTATYDNLEVVLLDYNSKDGTEEWAKENLIFYITSGKLTYYKTNEPTTWNPSHSKNIAFKLATGDIVCSIWADYYTGRGFPQYVNDCFQDDSNIVITPIDFHKTRKNYNPPGDVLGKVCVKKRDFLTVGGFDERMNKHGFEDYDFVNRLEMIGRKRKLIEDYEFLKYLSHGDSERFNLREDYLEGMYVSYIDPATSEILLLFKDGHFERGKVIDNQASAAERLESAYLPHNNYFEYDLELPGWILGNWKDTGNAILCISANGCHISLVKLNIPDRLLEIQGEATFYRICKDNVIEELLRFRHFMYTRTIMEENLREHVTVVNKEGFGRASVYKNFESTIYNNDENNYGN